MELLTRERSLVAVFLPTRTADESAHHALDVDTLCASDVHGAGQPVAAHRLRDRLLDVVEEVVGHDAGGLPEPPPRHLREHGALSRNRCWQDHVEDAQPVGGNHQQGAVGELKGIAHLAAPEEVQVADIGGAHHLHQLILPPARPASSANAGADASAAERSGGVVARPRRRYVSSMWARYGSMSKQCAIVDSERAPVMSASTVTRSRNGPSPSRARAASACTTR